MPVTIGNNSYKTTKINNCLWMAENLREPIGVLGEDYILRDNDEKYGYFYKISSIVTNTNIPYSFVYNKKINTETKCWEDTDGSIKTYFYQFDKNMNFNDYIMYNKTGKDVIFTNISVIDFDNPCNKFNHGVLKNNIMAYTYEVIDKFNYCVTVNESDNIDISKIILNMGQLNQQVLDIIQDDWYFPTLYTFIKLDNFLKENQTLKLKSNTDWIENNGTNGYNFNAYPTGSTISDTTFIAYGRICDILTLSPSSNINKQRYLNIFYEDTDSLYYGAIDISRYMSIRLCKKL